MNETLATLVSIAAILGVPLTVWTIRRSVKDSAREQARQEQEAVNKLKQNAYNDGYADGKRDEQIANQQKQLDDMNRRDRRGTDSHDD